MKEEWKVTSNYFNGEYKYRVYRRLRADEPDHSGNREYACEWISDRAVCEMIAKKLNEKGW